MLVAPITTYTHTKSLPKKCPFSILESHRQAFFPHTLCIWILIPSQPLSVHQVQVSCTHYLPSPPPIPHPPCYPISVLHSPVPLCLMSNNKPLINCLQLEWWWWWWIRLWIRQTLSHDCLHSTSAAWALQGAYLRPGR